MFEKGGDYPALIIDLLRRTGKFKNAEVICENRLKVEDDDLLKKVLTYQSYLIESRNVGTHSIYDAERYSESISEEETESVDDYDADFDDNSYDSEPDYDRDYFDAMTDGQLGDYDDFDGNIDDIDTWARG